MTAEPSTATSAGSPGDERGPDAAWPAGWWRPFAAVAVAMFLVAIVAAVVLRSNDRYASSAVLLVDQPSLLRQTGDLGIVAKLAELRGMLAALAPTDAVAGEAARELGIDPEGLAEDVEVGVPVDSLVLRITVRADTAADARARTAAVTAALDGWLDDSQEAAGVPAGDRIELATVAPAGPGARSDDDGKRLLAVSAITVVIVGLAAVALWPSRAASTP